MSRVIRAPEHLVPEHDVSTVDSQHQGTGLGGALLRDALLRTLQAAEFGGIRAVLLPAVSEEAKRFYLHYGFAESPVDPMTMMITLADLEKALGG